MSVQKKFDDTGATAEWDVRENCTWSRTFTVSQGSTAVDVSGYTISAAVTASEISDEPLKQFTLALVSTNAFRIFVDADDADLPPGRYWWSMQWNDGTNDVPLASGNFVVKHWAL